MRLIKQLPDPFALRDGGRTASVDEWRRRREEIKETMLGLQYGTLPGPPERSAVTPLESQSLAGGETRQRLRFEFIPNAARPEIGFGMDATVWHPAEASLARRRQTVSRFGDTGIPTLVYVGDKKCEPLLERGYRVICYDNSQLEPMEMGNPIVGPARAAYRTLWPERYSWGSIAVWAWGALRLVDYALGLSDTDPRQIAISGHSRNGKTALLAAALDERIALANPAGSGCAGAGSYLALGENCEDLAALTSRQRWWAWTHPDFERWAGREVELPFDQHFLMALVAPRPLLRTEGEEDEWANPEGTCVSFLATQPVYDFLGVPEANGIRFRPGGHDHTPEDLEALADFADAAFFGRPSTEDFKRLLRPQPSFPAAFAWRPPRPGR